VRLVSQDVGVPFIDDCPSPRLQRNVVDVNWSVQRCARFVTLRVNGQPSVSLPKSFLAG